MSSNSGWLSKNPRYSSGNEVTGLDPSVSDGDSDDDVCSDPLIISSKNVVASPDIKTEGELLPVEGAVNTASGVSKGSCTLIMGVMAAVVVESKGVDDSGVDNDDVPTGTTGVATAEVTWC